MLSQDSCKKMLLFALASMLAAAVAAQPGAGFSEHELESAGARRGYLLYLPESHAGDPLPLVFSFHGSGGVPRTQVDISNFDKLAERHGFAVVFPAGAFTNAVTARSWNANMEEGVDDVQFVRDMIEDVASMINIDRARIYTSGFSGGARMSSRLACELSDVLAAAAPVAGLQYPDGCTPERPIPIITFHGAADATNHYTLRDDSPPYWRMGVATALDRWRQANGCSPAGDEKRLSQQVTFHEWDDCGNGARIHFYRIDDGGHTWPGREADPEYTARAGITNMDIDASELIWAFFSRHSRD